MTSCWRMCHGKQNPNISRVARSPCVGPRCFLPRPTPPRRCMYLHVIALETWFCKLMYQKGFASLVGSFGCKSCRSHRRSRCVVCCSEMFWQCAVIGGPVLMCVGRSWDNVYWCGNCGKFHSVAVCCRGRCVANMLQWMVMCWKVRRRNVSGYNSGASVLIKCVNAIHCVF